MTENTIKDYNTMIENMGILMEKASKEEYILLEAAMETLQEAKLQTLNEKDHASTMLYESGDMGEDDYIQYQDYINEEKMEVESVLTPYAEEVGIATSLTLSESENIALESAKFYNIMSKDEGEMLESAERKFIKSRANKYGMICESSDLLPYEDDIKSDVMTEGIRDFLENAHIAWKNYKVSSEKAAKEYIKESIEEHGDTSYVTEAVNQAVEDGAMEEFMTKQFRKMIAVEELRAI